MTTPPNNKDFTKSLMQSKQPAKPKRKAAQIPDAERAIYKQWQAELSERKHPNLTPQQRGKPKPVKFTRYSNFLEASIQDWAKLKGYACNKVQTTGTSRNGKFTFSGATKGVEDLQLFVHGKMYALEVKAGSDTMKSDQIRRKEALEAQGFEYTIIHTLTQFIEWAQSKAL